MQAFFRRGKALTGDLRNNFIKTNKEDPDQTARAEFKRWVGKSWTAWGVNITIDRIIREQESGTISLEQITRCMDDRAKVSVLTPSRPL